MTLFVGTLLNLLFDTKFEILDAQKLGRAQITKGVWMSASRDGSILIFDLEGTDSKERGEQRLVCAQNFSHTLFRLSSRLRHFSRWPSRMCSWLTYGRR